MRLYVYHIIPKMRYSTLWWMIESFPDGFVIRHRELFVEFGGDNAFQVQESYRCGKSVKTDRRHRGDKFCNARCIYVPTW